MIQNNETRHWQESPRTKWQKLWYGKNGIIPKRERKLSKKWFFPIFIGLSIGMIYYFLVPADKLLWGFIMGLLFLIIAEFVD